MSLVALLLPLLSYAKVECTERPECWPDGSAMQQGLLHAERERKAEERLAKMHVQLVELVSDTGNDQQNERIISALGTQQLAWHKYVAEECELVGALTGAGGTWPSTYARKCSANHTEQRLRRVSSAVQCIKKLAPQDRQFSMSQCLQQLAPLTNK